MFTVNCCAAGMQLEYEITHLESTDICINVAPMMQQQTFSAIDCQLVCGS